jgi:hypothetical protein
MKLKSNNFLGAIVGLLFVVNLSFYSCSSSGVNLFAQSDCDESTMSLEEAKQQLTEIFSNNLGQKALGFQMSYNIQFEGCKATVTKDADSKKKHGRPTVYSFNLQDLVGENVKFYAVKNNTQLTIGFDKKIIDSNEKQYITFADVTDNELANTLPKLLSHVQCLCAKSIK